MFLLCLFNLTEKDPFRPADDSLAILPKKFDQLNALNPAMTKLFHKNSDGWCAGLSTMLQMIHLNAVWPLFYADLMDPVGEAPSPVSQVLLQFICNRQQDPVLGIDCELPHQIAELSLTLHNGTQLIATTTTSLFQQLWMAEEDAHYIWLGQGALRLFSEADW